MDDGRIDRLERLQKLRESGVLDDPEFLSEKKRVLADGDQERHPRNWLTYAAFVAPILLGGIVAGIWARESVQTPKPESAPLHQIAKATPVTAVVPAAVPRRSEADRIADAFQAATGHRATFAQMKDGELVTTNPIRIIQLPFGSALLTRREVKDGCHACTGAIGVYYLKEQGNTTTVTGRWPKAVEGWGWGAAPTEWFLTDKFTALPSIYASGAFMGQGIIEESATLTELRPDGPVTSDVIGTGFSDEGAIVDNQRAPCLVKGRIGNVRKDRSFDVIVTGSVKAVDHYVKRNEKFVPASKIDWGIPCGGG